MIKKKIVLVLLSILFFTQPSQAKEIKIVTSFYPMYIMAKNVTRDIPGISLENLTSAYIGCLHDYGLTVRDMKVLSQADIFIANGAGMEAFLDKILIQYPHLKIVQLSKGIELINDNPHVWVSISDAIIEVKNLGMALEEFDPDHAKLYQKNTFEYIEKLEILRKKMIQELAPYKGRPIVTFHEAFPYFAKEFGFNIVAVVEREPGSTPSARELKDTIELIKKSGVNVLFSEPQYPSSAVNVISRETHIKVYVLDPAVTGPDDYDAYINIMENNLSVLKKALEE
ncbi:MAG: metal ABC transporter substrate-binding protein [Candidatus Omnitrophota bacterium]